MKTNLNVTIENKDQAEKFLTELHSNSEAFHPDDDPADIVWHSTEPTEEEKEKLRSLMHAVCHIEGFDPYYFLMDISGSIPSGRKDLSFYTKEYFKTLYKGELKDLIDALEDRMNDVLKGDDVTDKYELNRVIGDCIDEYKKK